jgi:hypothetical protein
MEDARHALDRIDPARCRQHVEERFSPELMTDRYSAIYRSILDESARRRQTVLVPAPPKTTVSPNGTTQGARAIV